MAAPWVATAVLLRIGRRPARWLLRRRLRRDARVRELVEGLEALPWHKRAAVLRGIASDARVPPSARVVLVLTAAYVAFPLDLIPDFIPVLGQLDDALVVAAGLWVALRMVPPEVVREHLARAGSTVGPGR